MKNVGLNSIPSVRGHILNLTLNLIAIGIFYIVLGAVASHTLWRVFPSFNEEWKKASRVYQSLDVFGEVSLLVIIAFWATYYVNSYIPILPVSTAVESYIESFGGQMIFVYVLFLFVGTLDDKILFVFHDLMGTKPEE